MPSGTPAARQTVEVSKQGEYAITIGDSLKRSHNSDSDTFTSVQYNFKASALLQNPVPPRLTRHAATGEAPYTLTLTPPATSANSSTTPVIYTGSQHVPPRKAECILIFDPTTQRFTLEKLSSTFTFNAKVYAGAHPPLPLRPPILDGEDDDASMGEKDVENPFDYRHFINKKGTTKKTKAEIKAEQEERRKKALKRAGKGAPEDDEPEEEDEDELPGLGISYDRPKIGGKGFLTSPAIGPKKVGGKSPFGGKKPAAMSPGIPLPSPAHRAGDSSSDEDESDEADDEDEVSDEEAAPLPPPPPRSIPVGKKPPVLRGAAARRKAQQEDPEELVFPEPVQLPHAEDQSEEESSDADESDEDAPPPQRLSAVQVPQEEEEEDDDLDLEELLEKELENGDGDGDLDGEGEPDTEIIFEEDEVVPRGPPKVVGLGIGSTGVPMSLGQMVGGNLEDESESESEEE